MQISQIRQQNSIYNFRIKPHRQQSMANNNTTNFKGHYLHEKVVINNKAHYLVQQTSFFRDLETKKFVKEYIDKTFATKDKIKILVGACSTGEECYSYAMLLDNIKSKLSINGFDISSKAIKQAQSGKVLMQREIQDTGFFITKFTNRPSDSFLCFDQSHPLSTEQIKLISIFNSFFNIEPNIKKEKLPIFKTLKESINRRLEFKPYYNFEEKIATAKPDKFKNCSFKVGDILNLTKVLEMPNSNTLEKADVITFSNAMYHLTTENPEESNFLRIQKENCDEIIKDIATNIKKCLNKDGLFVLGENEDLQQPNLGHLIYKIFIESGFSPLNKNSCSSTNIWKLK